MAYIKRDMEEKILFLSQEYPCLLVTGPRQVGKTTVLRQLMTPDRNYVTLDAKIATPAPSARDLSTTCIFRPSESKETVGVSPPSREKQVQVHGRESTGVLFGKKWQRNASQSAPPRVIYSDWNPFLLRMESSPSMRIL